MIGTTLVETLERFDMRYPPAVENHLTKLSLSSRVLVAGELDITKESWVMKDQSLLMIPGPIEFEPAVLAALGAPTPSHVAQVSSMCLDKPSSGSVEIPRA